VLKVEALRNQLPIDIPHGYTDMQPELNKHVTGLLSSLVTRYVSFVYNSTVKPL